MRYEAEGRDRWNGGMEGRERKNSPRSFCAFTVTSSNSRGNDLLENEEFIHYHYNDITSI